jgi:hypothetical protein
MGNDEHQANGDTSIPIDDEPWYMKPQPKGATPTTTPGISHRKPFNELTTDQARQVITRAVRWGVFQGLLIFAAFWLVLFLVWAFLSYTIDTSLYMN